MRIISLFLLLLLLFFQYRLWFGEGGVTERQALRTEINQQILTNAKQNEENTTLRLKIEAQSRDASLVAEEIEGRARAELGFIKEGETFYWLRENTE